MQTSEWLVRARDQQEDAARWADGSDRATCWGQAQTPDEVRRDRKNVEPQLLQLEESIVREIESKVFLHVLSGTILF